MSTGLWVLLAAVTAALCLGAHRAWVDGRFRGTHRVRGVDPARSDRPAVTSPPPSVLEGTAFADSLGDRATLLQFSSAFCAPCRATRHTLAAVAACMPGVAHVEVDAEHHLELVRHLGILRTPTTLVLDPDGRELARASGAPRSEQVVAALATAG